MADAIETFDETPEGSAKRWQVEFKAAREALSSWHKTAEECDRKYRDEDDRDGDALNLFAAGVDLKEAVLDATSPSVDVARRNNDQDDDIARVAAEVLKRVLNGDMEREEENFPEALALSRKDWLIPGFGIYWNRLERKIAKVPAQEPKLDEEGNEIAPAVPETTKVVDEDVRSDYLFWKDWLHSPCRVFGEMRWAAKVARISKKTFAAKFGAEETPPFAVGADPKDPTIPKTPWARIEVHEIWDKENACVWFYVEDHPRVLVPLDLKGNARPDGSIPDPLQLSTFWPFPEPLIEGNTNTKYVPRPSYARVQDQYRAVDDETTRIGLLRDALKAAGVYDKTVGELQDLLKPDAENKMVPAQNYKALAEKGGIAACIAWLPLDAIVEALGQLRELRREDIELLYQVDGTSDIMRGQATDAGTTATEQAIKAKYGSIRGGKAQKRFTAFASDGQRIRAEIICKHFSPETIAARASVRSMPQEDQQYIPKAIALLKSDGARFRIAVKAESVSLTDYAANKQEALDVLGMIGQFVQAIGPLMQQAPQAIPSFLRLLQVFISRVKGGDAAEPVLDELVKQATTMAAQPPPPPPPDPKAQIAQAQVQTAQVKAGAETAKAHMGVVQTQLETQQAIVEHQQSMQQLEGEVRADALKTALAPGAAG